MNIQNSTVPALERALNIIEYIASQNEPVTLKQIVKDLEIPSASAFRLIKNLVIRGYITELTGGHMAYILGDKLMSIASRYERNSSLHLAAKPIMLSLADQVGQTVQLGIWKNGSLIYIDQAFSRAPLSIIAPLYEPVPLNASASAKVLLGYLTDKERTQAIASCSFEKLTVHTITDKDVFLKEVENSSACGYGYDNEEFSIGIGCLAVPILDRQKNCIGAIGTTGSIQEYQTPSTFQKMLNALKDASAKITHSLGAANLSL